MIILLKFIDKGIIFITSGFGIGYISHAQGTFGSIFGIIIILILTKIEVEISLNFLIIIIFFSSLLCHRANLIYEDDDSKHIVLDEIIGILVATYNVPVTFLNFLICFLFFRFFDILKPFPISFIDKNFKNGFGIILDDVLAGILSNILFIVFSSYFLKFS